MNLGVEKGKVILCEHDEKWEQTALEVITRLKTVLGDYAIDIQHVGSTSIKGIPAKPIIDIAVGVIHVNNVRNYEKVLNSVGIIIDGAPVPQQIMCEFSNGDNLETHHIHFVEYNSKPWKDYINFRDYLNTHPVTAERYAEKKRELSVKYAGDRANYTKGKIQIITEILKEANEWKHGSAK